MALAEGSNVEEGERLFALEELHAGDLACDGQAGGKRVSASVVLTTVAWHR